MEASGLLGGSGDILTGIGIFFFGSGASDTFLMGIGILSFLGGALGRSLLDLRFSLFGPFFGIALAGEADWRRSLLGESERVLDLSGGIDETELALDLTKGVPMASLCLALLAKVLPNKPGDLDRPWVLLFADLLRGLVRCVRKLPPSE